jgi:FAD/FMN-containing dehydrogenase
MSHHMFLYTVATLFTIFLSTALAASNGTVADACKALEAAVPLQITYAGEKAYKAETANYYNYGNTQLKPGCIAQPQSKEATSKIVQVLNQYPGVRFAVKSGGHDPNAGHSSIDGGILIAMSQLNGTVNDAANNIAYVKPGGHWQTVTDTLDKQGVAVVGGRLGKCLP